MNFFEDKDGNYIGREEGKPVVIQLIIVGNEVFRTDKNGTIKYKGSPRENMKYPYCSLMG